MKHIESGTATRYYFDIDDGEYQTHDEEGFECRSRSDIRSAAIAALPELARDVLPESDRTMVQVKVRDESGRYVFHATLSLVAAWLE